MSELPLFDIQDKHLERGEIANQRSPAEQVGSLTLMALMPSLDFIEV